MMKKTLATESESVSKYLTAFAYMLADVINDKAVCKKDKKWLRDIVLSIFKIQDVLDMAIVYNNVIKRGKIK